MASLIARQLTLIQRMFLANLTNQGEIMHYKNLVLLPAVLLMAACGGTYQVSSSDPAKGTPQSFASDEIECNKTNFLVSSTDNGTQKIYMTERYLACMESKGWKFKKTGSKFSFIKAAE